MRMVVGLSGNISRPSRTQSLVQTVCSHVAADGEWDSRCYDLVDVGPHLGATSNRGSASPEHLRIWDAVVGCDVLVVGSPVYKASYTGLFKHFFDLIDQTTLVRKPVIVAATGKALQHGLVVEQHLKALFGFFDAWPIPTAIYATDGDFLPDGAPSDALRARITKAVDELAFLLKS